MCTLFSMVRIFKPLASAALFDLGVYLVVVGATLLTISVLGTVSREAPKSTTRRMEESA